MASALPPSVCSAPLATNRTQIVWRRLLVFASRRWPEGQRQGKAPPHTRSQRIQVVLGTSAGATYGAPPIGSLVQDGDILFDVMTRNNTVTL
jgi:hypothetical protein